MGGLDVGVDIALVNRRWCPRAVHPTRNTSDDARVNRRAPRLGRGQSPVVPYYSSEHSIYPLVLNEAVTAGVAKSPSLKTRDQMLADSDPKPESEGAAQIEALS